MDTDAWNQWILQYDQQTQRKEHLFDGEDGEDEEEEDDDDEDYVFDERDVGEEFCEDDIQNTDISVRRRRKMHKRMLIRDMVHAAGSTDIDLLISFIEQDNALAMKDLQNPDNQFKFTTPIDKIVDFSGSSHVRKFCLQWSETNHLLVILGNSILLYNMNLMDYRTPFRPFCISQCMLSQENPTLIIEDNIASLDTPVVANEFVRRYVDSRTCYKKADFLPEKAWRNDDACLSFCALTSLDQFLVYSRTSRGFNTGFEEIWRYPPDWKVKSRPSDVLHASLQHLVTCFAWSYAPAESCIFLALGVRSGEIILWKFDVPVSADGRPPVLLGRIRPVKRKVMGPFVTSLIFIPTISGQNFRLACGMSDGQVIVLEVTKETLEVESCREILESKSLRTIDWMCYHQETESLCILRVHELNVIRIKTARTTKTLKVGSTVAGIGLVGETLLISDCDGEIYAMSLNGEVNERYRRMLQDHIKCSLESDDESSLMSTVAGFVSSPDHLLIGFLAYPYQQGLSEVNLWIVPAHTMSDDLGGIVAPQPEHFCFPSNVQRCLSPYNAKLLIPTAFEFETMLIDRVSKDENWYISLVQSRESLQKCNCWYTAILRDEFLTTEVLEKAQTNFTRNLLILKWSYLFNLLKLATENELTSLAVRIAKWTRQVFLDKQLMSKFGIFIDYTAAELCCDILVNHGFDTNEILDYYLQDNQCIFDRWISFHVNNDVDNSNMNLPEETGESCPLCEGKVFFGRDFFESICERNHKLRRCCASFQLIGLFDEFSVCFVCNSSMLSMHELQIRTPFLSDVVENSICPFCRCPNIPTSTIV